MTLGFVIFLVICVALYLRFRHPTPSLGTAYAGERDLTLWDSSAQVRSPVASVSYGEPLRILQQFGNQMQVRSPNGAVGWTTTDELISTELWQQEKDLDITTAAQTVEAQGHTRVLSNLHLVAGRESPRVWQLKKDIPIKLYERTAVAIPVSGSAPAPASTAESDTDQGASSSNPNEPKREDWWLVRAQPDDKTSVSGWLLGRFVDLDVPAPLPDYASSANMRIVAWFELNPAPDANGQLKRQYLLVGTDGPEGQACDFTSMRVYTWAKTKAQYETAFVQSGICGKLPVRITRMPSAQEATISFKDPGDGIDQFYRMHQTIVRRVKDDDATRKGKR
jgi:hypothetical protein